MRLGGTSTLAPVFGLRPTRPRRCRVRKLPNPRISILSPVCNAWMMESKIVSTIASDSLRGSSVARMTSSTRSALVMVVSFIAIDSPIVQNSGLLPNFPPPFQRPGLLAMSKTKATARILEAALRQNGVSYRRRRGGFGRPVILHFPTLGVAHCRSITEADFVLVGIDLYNLEIVFTPRRKHGRRPALLRPLFLVLIPSAT